MDEQGIYCEQLKQLTAIAATNNNHISYTIVADVLRDSNSSISVDSMQCAISELTSQGIHIDPFENDENYAESDKIPEGCFIPADVNIRQRNMTVDAVVDRLSHDEIDLYPNFQRRSDLWTTNQQSLLIESLMLKIPLPAFYFDAADDDKWVVIDGLQRLTAFKNFMVSGNLSLTGLEYLTELNGMHFNQLPRQYYRRIRESQITVYTVEKGTPDAVVYNIFKRINTGGIKLEPEEIRHALYQGKATLLVEKLATSKSFLTATGGVISSQRMLDYEYITRYLAFTEQDYSKEYQDNIDLFLNNALKKINRYSDADIARIETNFYQVMHTCYLIFGKYAFRRVGSNGRRGPINKAIFELWAICLSPLKKSQINTLITRKTTVVNEFNELLMDQSFSSAIKSGDKYSLASRVSKVKKMLEGILNDPKNST